MNQEKTNQTPENQNTASVANAGTSPSPDNEKVFTQEQVNSIVGNVRAEISKTVEQLREQLNALKDTKTKDGAVSNGIRKELADDFVKLYPNFDWSDTEAVEQLKSKKGIYFTQPEAPSADTPTIVSHPETGKASENKNTVVKSTRVSRF